MTQAAGYRLTEVGQIPEEWELVRLKELVESYKNGIYKRPKFYGKGTPSVRMYNIEDGKVNTRDAPLLQVSEQELNDYGLSRRRTGQPRQ